MGSGSAKKTWDKLTLCASALAEVDASNKLCTATVLAASVFVLTCGTIRTRSSITAGGGEKESRSRGQKSIVDGDHAVTKTTQRLAVAP